MRHSVGNGSGRGEIAAATSTKQNCIIYSQTDDLVLVSEVALATPSDLERLRYTFDGDLGLRI
jgi:hypothetical protein